MIFKYELVDAINNINHDLTLLSIKLSDLEEKVEKLESKLCKCNKVCPKKCEKKTKETAKRGPGRPRKV